MRANESNKVMRIDSLRSEQLDQRVGGVFVRRQETDRSGFGVVFAADEGADARTERARDGSDVGAELYDVGHGQAVLVVLGVPFVGLVGNCGEAVVVCAGHFVA